MKGHSKTSFLIREISGSLGDLPLFFIFFVGLTQFSNLNPLSILFWSGVAHIVVGLFFKVPLSFQPMKAMALFAIAHGVSQAELLTAGIAIGAIILVLNTTGIFQKIYNVFPVSVIRGIQLGLALMLLNKSFELIAADTYFVNSTGLAGLLIIFFFLFFLKKYHYLLILGLFGFAISFMFSTNLLEFPALAFSNDFFQIHLNSLKWSETVLTLILIQLPLTTANSIFSPALLIKDYFPKKKIKASSIATSVGLINLLTCPLGGMPACHGAGGLAAQYRFGARTGLSVVFLGVFKICTALFLGGFFIQMAQQFPRALLGILFIFPAYDLGMRALRMKGMANSVVILATSTAYVLWHAGWAMLIGCFVYVGFYLFERNKIYEHSR